MDSKHGSKGHKLNIADLLGMNEFLPHYQREKEGKFDTLLSRYMDQYHKPEKGVSWIGTMKHGIKHTNKKIMLDKLGLSLADDMERLKPEEFKKVFVELAKEHPEILADGEKLIYKASLPHKKNEAYETIWKATNDKVRGNGRSK